MIFWLKSTHKGNFISTIDNWLAHGWKKFANHQEDSKKWQHKIFKSIKRLWTIKKAQLELNKKMEETYMLINKESNNRLRKVMTSKNFRTNKKSNKCWKNCVISAKIRNALIIVKDFVNEFFMLNAGKRFKIKIFCQLMTWPGSYNCLNFVYTKKT